MRWLVLLILLAGCAGKFEDLSTCPPWPIAGPKVERELAQLPTGPEFAYTREWFSRLQKLKKQLDRCKP